jgi:ribosomal protein L9
MKMKSGPDGHLFGGVGYKHIMEEVKKKFPSGAFDGKHVKITSIFTEKGNKDAGHDIKHVGNYKVTLLLMKDVSADFSLHISSLM